MAGSGGAKPSGNAYLVQALAARGRAMVLLAALAALLAGCAEASGPLDPVSWWHSIEGGPVAAKPQPIPGETAPYPNLADVPKPPHFTPATEREKISAALLADRAHAHSQMVLAPLAPPSKPAPPKQPTPAASSAGSAPVQAASAKLPAASPAPSAPVFPRAEAPAPLAPATVSEALALLPSVPKAPPPPPAIAGVRPPAPPPRPSAFARGTAIPLAFAPDSAALSPADRARLAALAARRGTASLAVVGHGGATASDADAQETALRLALARAKVVAAALAAAGVPLAALSVGAEASGNGALVRLVGGA